MKKKIYLKPTSKSILVIGEKGSGKTTFVSAFINNSKLDIDNKKLIFNISTQVEKRFIFSSEEQYRDSLGLVVKAKNNIYDFNCLYNDFVECFVLAIKKFRKLNDTKMHDVESFLRDSFVDKTISDNGIFSLLEKDFITSKLSKICSVFSKHLNKADMVYLYNAAKNSISRNDDKDSSAKLNERIMELAQSFAYGIFNGVNHSEFKSVTDDFNSAFEMLFFECFNKEDISADGYYFRNVPLNDICLKEYLKIIDYCCDKLIIYAPINNSFLNFIKKDERINITEFLKDQDGNISLELIDSKGVAFSDDLLKSSEYLQDVLYGNRYDAVVLIRSILTKSVQLDFIFDSVMRNLNVDTPIFVVNNKIDLFEQDKRKNSISSAESWGALESNAKSSADKTLENVDINDIVNSIEEELFIIRNKYEFAQKSRKKKLNINVVGTLFRYSSEETSDEIIKYLAINTLFRKLFFEMKNNFMCRDEKFDFYSDFSEEGLFVDINKDKIRNILSREITKASINKHRLVLMNNIISNFGVKFDKKSYYDVCEKFSFGNGSTGTVLNYSSDFKSFDLTFPGNIRSMLTDDLLFSVLSECVVIRGVSASSSELNNFLRCIIEGNKLIKYEFVSYILYDYILKNVEKESIFDSYSERFDKVLKECFVVFDDHGLLCDLMTDALVNIIEGNVVMEIKRNVNLISK